MSTIRTWRWDGTATALSSVTHGGETNGTVTYLRRERVMQPDGTYESVPVVSGNALRGVLRDRAADLFWEALDRPDLPLPVAQALWGGGALVKAKNEPLSGARLAELRRACPVVSVFGAAGGGRLIEGALQVGKLVPVCRETLHLLPPGTPIPVSVPSMWDLTQVESYTRLPGVAPGRTTEPATEPQDTASTGLMRYGVESFAAGTVFTARLALMNAFPADRAFLTETLALFDAAGARVGGRAKIGHGSIRLDLTESVLGGPYPEEKWRTEPCTDPARTLALLRRLD